tara:strand:- start:570 stop:758 length:189 start_codon:yes stop_codon:yes gene_type:complete
MLCYWKNLSFNFRLGIFLIWSGFLLITGAFFPFLSFHKNWDIHAIINRAAFIYFNSHSKKVD